LKDKLKRQWENKIAQFMSLIAAEGKFRSQHPVCGGTSS